MILTLFFTVPVFATDEDNPELGIEMKKGRSSASVGETLNKANTKIKRYEKAKTEVSQIFTGEPKQTLTPTAAKSDGPAVERKQIYLKNGQSLNGAITERDKNGVWVETDPGVRIYLRNEEVLES